MSGQRRSRWLGDRPRASSPRADGPCPRVPTAPRRRRGGRARFSALSVAPLQLSVVSLISICFYYLNIGANQSPKSICLSVWLASDEGDELTAKRRTRAGGVRRKLGAAAFGLATTAIPFQAHADAPGLVVDTAPTVRWSGFYAGLNVGLRIGGDNSASTEACAASDFSNPGNGSWAGAAARGATSPVSMKNVVSLLAGGQLGYNLHVSGAWVAGLEADIQGGGVSQSGATRTYVGPALSTAPTRSTRPRSRAQSASTTWEHFARDWAFFQSPTLCSIRRAAWPTAGPSSPPPSLKAATTAWHFRAIASNRPPSP